MKSFSKLSQDWLLASMVTAVSWGLAVILIFTTNELVTGSFALVANGLALLAGGLLVGIGQWLFLHPVVRRGVEWLLVSSVGWAAAVFLMWQLITFADLMVVQVFMATLLGLGFGLVQQLTTHHAGPDRRYWLFTTATQWGITWLITAVTLTEATTITTPGEMATIWLAGWGLLSVMTTLFLILMYPEAFGDAAQHFSDEWLSRPQTEEESEKNERTTPDR